MVRQWWPLLALLAFGSGCSQDLTPLTQLILVADTNIPSVDTVQFEISSQDRTQDRTATSAHAPNSEPSYVSLVRDEGSLGPITVSARALRGGVVLLERTERVYFVQNETRVVPLHLLQSCLNVTCPANQTCAASGCMSQDVPGSDLAPWTGQAPRLVVSAADGGTVVEPGADAGADASVMDGGAGDAGRPDASNMLMDAAAGDASTMDATVDARARDAATNFIQCNGSGPLVDLEADPMNCGMCGTKCGSGRTCVAGACVKK